MENAEEIYNVLKETYDFLQGELMTSRVMDTAKKVVESRLHGEILSYDTMEHQIVAKLDDDVCIFFVDWDEDDFPEPKITKKKFEETIRKFKDVFFSNDISDTSIIPGHIGFHVYEDRAFVCAAIGVGLK